MEHVNIDEINDIMTTFLDNVVAVAKIHTDYKEKLGEDHELTKYSCSMVKIFNQYQTLYVYIKDQEDYAKSLVELSNLVLALLAFTPYELMKGSFFKKRSLIRKNRKAKKEAFNNVTKKIDEINQIINQDMQVEEMNIDGTDHTNQESE